MPEQLWNTTLDPTKRRLKQITVDEAVEAEKTLSLLMGDKVRLGSWIQRPCDVSCRNGSRVSTRQWTTPGHGLGWPDMQRGKHGLGKSLPEKVWGGIEEGGAVPSFFCLAGPASAGGSQKGAYPCAGEEHVPSHVGYLTSLRAPGMGECRHQEYLTCSVLSTRFPPRGPIPLHEEHHHLQALHAIGERKATWGRSSLLYRIRIARTALCRKQTLQCRVEGDVSGANGIVVKHGPRPGNKNGSR